MDREPWRAVVYGVAKSQTRLTVLDGADETETDSQIYRTDLWLPVVREDERGQDWAFGSSSCKLVYIG